MSKTPILHPSKRHPLTGRRLEALGVLPNGKVIWPCMGGDDTVPPADPPEGVTAEEWEALGDPGKKAIIRERTRAEKAERDLVAARAKPAPPKADPPKPSEPKPSDPPDVAKIVQDAVAAAIKPFQDAESQRQAEAAAGKVRDAVVEAAKSRLHDASDAVANIDLTKVLDDQGVADPVKIAAELDDLVKRKPHLAKSATLLAPAGIGGGAPAAATDAEKVKAVLADMQKATGIRVAQATN